MIRFDHVPSVGSARRNDDLPEETMSEAWKKFQETNGSLVDATSSAFMKFPPAVFLAKTTDSDRVESRIRESMRRDPRVEKGELHLFENMGRKMGFFQWWLPRGVAGK